MPLRLPLGAWIVFVGLCAALPGYLYGSIVINEFMSSNGSTVADEDASFEDWIELRNLGASTVNLLGWSLSDSSSQPQKWSFAVPIEIEPGGFVLVWASGKNRQQWVPGTRALGVSGTFWPHTNFSIAAAGEPLVLSRPDGSLADSVPPVEVPRDWSYGRIPGTVHDWGYFFEATPGLPNTTAWLEQLIAPVDFSVESGFFSEPITLNLSHSDPNAVIVYTLDGSEPDLQNLAGSAFQYMNSYPSGPLLSHSYISSLYEQALTLTDRSAAPNQISQISTTGDSAPGYLPNGPLKKGTVVRARAFVDGVAGPMSTHTYFISATGAFDSTLPIVSLVAPARSLFDFVEGIHVAGIDRVQRLGFQICDFGNYNRRGREAEAAGHFAYFVNGEHVVDHSAGIRIQGNCSRQRAFKSLRLYARNTLESPGVFEFPFFEERVPGTVAPGNQRFQRITLRAPNFNDFVFSRLFQPVYEGVAGRVQPALQYLNGEFWGLSIVRERFDAEYVHQHFGLDPDNVSIIVIRYRHEVPPPAPFSFNSRVFHLSEGIPTDMDDYLAMRAFVEGQNMGDNEAYEVAQSMLCLDSFIDHLILKIFAGDDHYAPEFVFWRARLPEDDGLGDGRWRVFVKDFDSSLVSGNYVTGLATGSHPRPFGYQMFASLLQNEDFRHRFINRFADLLNTDFRTERFQQIIQDSFDLVSPYWLEVSQRWNNAPLSNPDRPFTASRRDELLTWAAQQPARQRAHLSSHFQMAGEIQLSLVLGNPGQGRVRVNTKEHTSANWTGIYFRSVPLTLNALPEPGHRFVGWRVEGGGVQLDEQQTTSAAITVQPTGSLTIHADFEPLAEVLPTVFLSEGSGAWHLASNWSSGVVPNAGGAFVVIPAPGITGNRDVNLAAPVTVGQLQIDNQSQTARHRLRDQPAGSQLSFDNGADAALLQVGGTGAGFVELTVVGGVVLNSDLRLQVDQMPGDMEFGALRLRETWTGVGGIIKSGPGKASFTGGGKTFSGPVRVEQGVLSFTEPSVAIEASGVTVWPGAQLRLVSSTSSSSPERVHRFGGDITLAGSGWAEGPEGVGAGVLGALRYEPGTQGNVAVVENEIVLAAPASIHVDGTRNDLVLAGAVSAAFPLHKSGGGTLVFVQDSEIASLTATGPVAVAGAWVSTETIDVPVLKALLSTVGLEGNGYLQIESPLAQSTSPERIDLFLEGPLFPGDRLQGGVVAADSTDLATWLQTTEVRMLVPDSTGTERLRNRAYRIARESDELTWRIVAGNRIEVLKKGAPTAFEHWRGLHFADAANRANDALSGPLADPNDSGMTNLMRYTLGLALNDPPAGFYPELKSVEQGDDKSLHFELRRYRLAADVDLEFEFSEDLETWQVPSAGWARTVEGDPNDERFEWITLAFPPLIEGQGPLFLRVVVSVAE